jgi:Flp pilus assembly protein TadD
VSLINDALKTAQREKRSGASPVSEGQPLLDGFFPYVSTAPSRRRSRRSVTLAAGAAVVVVLLVATWLVVRTPRRTAGSPSANAPSLVTPRQATQKPTSRAPGTMAGRPASTAGIDSVDGTPQPAPFVPPRANASASRAVTAPDRVILRSAVPTSSRVDSAIARPEQMLSRTPPPARATSRQPDYEAQATALFNLGDLKGARDNFALATRLAPTARAWTNYGVTLQKLGDLNGASAAYQSAIGIDGNYLEAWLYAGRLAVRMGEPDKAIPLFQRARSINPKHSEVNTELAELEWNANNVSESRRFADEAVRANASNARAHWFLAISADKQNDSDVAIREFTAYLQTIGTAERDNLQSVGWARTRLQQLKEKP